MKILMIAPQPFFEPRGTPISVYQRLHALSALGYQVDLLTYHLGQPVNIPGVKIHRIPTVPFIKHVKIGPSLPKLFLDIFLFLKALMLLMTKRYDVIHSHEEAAFIAAILAPLSGARHVYDMHSSLPQQLENFNFGNNWLIVGIFTVLEKWVVKTCDALITIGADLEQYVTSIHPISNQIKIENLAVHSFDSSTEQKPGAGLEDQLGTRDKHVIVYTGTFERYQGLGLLLESAAIVKQHEPQVVFIIVGGNSQQVAYWQNQASQAQLDDHVIFTGAVSPAETLRYMDLAEILVSPRTEGTSVPLKIYSYLHSGKPTVATNLAAHTQVLNEDIAVLVDLNGQAVAEGILKLIDSPDLRQHIGQQAQAFAMRRFNPADYLAKMEQIYQTLVRPVDVKEPSVLAEHTARSACVKQPFSSKTSTHQLEG